MSQGEESDGGSVKSGGDAQNKGGLDDYAANQRKNLGDFEDYVKVSVKVSKMRTSYLKISGSGPNVKLVLTKSM